MLKLHLFEVDFFFPRDGFTNQEINLQLCNLSYKSYLPSKTPNKATSIFHPKKYALEKHTSQTSQTHEVFFWGSFPSWHASNLPQKNKKNYPKNPSQSFLSSDISSKHKLTRFIRKRGLICNTKNIQENSAGIFFSSNRIMFQKDQIFPLRKSHQIFFCATRWAPRQWKKSGEITPLIDYIEVITPSETPFIYLFSAIYRSQKFSQLHLLNARRVGNPRWVPSLLPLWQPNRQASPMPKQHSMRVLDGGDFLVWENTTNPEKNAEKKRVVFFFEKIQVTKYFWVEVFFFRRNVEKVFLLWGHITYLSCSDVQTSFRKYGRIFRSRVGPGVGWFLTAQLVCRKEFPSNVVCFFLMRQIDTRQYTHTWIRSSCHGVFRKPTSCRAFWTLSGELRFTYFGICSEVEVSGWSAGEWRWFMGVKHMC